MSEPPRPSEAQLARPEQLERRAGWLLLGLLLVLLASTLYVLYARGVFEATQRLVLLADDSEGVSVGADLTFSGFPVGRVSRIELSAEGRVRILIDVPRRDARWLRSSSVFTMSRAMVGSTQLRAFSGNLSDPPLPDGAERKVLAGDATSEIPKLVSQVKDLLGNLTALTAVDGALAGSLVNTQALTDKMMGPQGALGVLFGKPEDARKLLLALDRANQLLSRLDAVALRSDGVLQRTDGLMVQAQEQVFGSQGLARDAQTTVRQLNAVLADVRGSLQKADAVLTEAQTTARNFSASSTDLGKLRADVETSLRRVDGLVNELNRKWPFQRDTEVKLP